MVRQAPGPTFSLLARTRRATEANGSLEVPGQPAAIGARAAQCGAGKHALEGNQIESVGEVLDVELRGEGDVLVQLKILARGEAERRMRPDEPTLEVDLVKYPGGKLVHKVLPGNVGIEFHSIAAVVPAAECHPEAARQSVLARLKNDGVPLVFLDFHSLARARKRISRLAQKQAAGEGREAVDVQVRVADEAREAPHRGQIQPRFGPPHVGARERGGKND